MSLSNNPLVRAARSFGNDLQAAGNDIKGGVVDAYSSFQKTELGQGISELAGDIGSGFNQLTGGNVEVDGPPGSGLGPLDSATLGSNGVVQTAVNAFNDFTSFTETIGSDPDSAAVVNAIDKISGGKLGGAIQEAAGTFGIAAGQLNDLLSLKRSANINNSAELFSLNQVETTVDPTPVNDWRVRISTNFNNLGIKNNDIMSRIGSNGTNGVIFPYQPRINFSTRANYNEIEPVHSNYPILAYKNSQVDEIQISGEFSAETGSDAQYWLASVQFFRTATKMFYGQGQNLGNPPVICYLNGYGSWLFNNIPVVITSFNLDFPDDVNYVKYTDSSDTTKSTWVPILSTLQVNCKPIYNRSNLRQFNLQSFAAGQMTTGRGKGYL